MQTLKSKKGAAMMLVITIMAVIVCLVGVAMSAFTIMTVQKRNNLKEIEQMNDVDAIGKKFVDGEITVTGNQIINQNTYYCVYNADFSGDTYNRKKELVIKKTQDSATLLIVDIDNDGKIINWSTTALE